MAENEGFFSKFVNKFKARIDRGPLLDDDPTHDENGDLNIPRSSNPGYKEASSMSILLGNKRDDQLPEKKE